VPVFLKKHHTSFRNNIDTKMARCREERFSLPVKIVPRRSGSSATLGLKKNNDVTYAYTAAYLHGTNKTVADVVTDAVEGIIKQGITLGEQREAQSLAQQLRDVAHFASQERAGRYPKIPSQIGKTCVNMYSKESFWCKLINRVLRSSETITHEELRTLGPFCHLLQQYLIAFSTEPNFTVYRGLTLTAEQRKEFVEGHMQFMSFTSTSRNRNKAEQFGNTLLIIDLNVPDRWTDDENVNIRCGADISHLSDFPGEEEYLIRPGTDFQFAKYEHGSNNKHIIHLSSSEPDF
jgi:hypothetical protein